MTTNLRLTFSIFLNKNYCQYFVQYSTKFVHIGAYYNNSAMVQAIAWRRTGDGPLPDAILTHYDVIVMWVQHDKRRSLTTRVLTRNEACQYQRWCLIKWKRFTHNWSFVREIHQSSPMGSPHKSRWMGNFFYICQKKLLNKQSSLRRHDDHVTSVWWSQAVTSVLFRKCLPGGYMAW